MRLEEATETAFKAKFKRNMQMQNEGRISDTPTNFREKTMVVLATEPRRKKTTHRVSSAEKPIIKMMIVGLKRRNRLLIVDIATNLAMLRGLAK